MNNLNQIKSNEIMKSNQTHFCAHAHVERDALLVDRERDGAETRPRAAGRQAPLRLERRAVRLGHARDEQLELAGRVEVVRDAVERREVRVPAGACGLLHARAAVRRAVPAPLQTVAHAVAAPASHRYEHGCTCHPRKRTRRQRGTHEHALQSEAQEAHDSSFEHVPSPQAEHEPAGSAKSSNQTIIRTKSSKSQKEIKSNQIQTKIKYAN